MMFSDFHMSIMQTNISSMISLFFFMWCNLYDHRRARRGAGGNPWNFLMTFWWEWGESCNVWIEPLCVLFWCRWWRKCFGWLASAPPPPPRENRAPYAYGYMTPWRLMFSRFYLIISFRYNHQKVVYLYSCSSHMMHVLHVYMLSVIYECMFTCSHGTYFDGYKIMTLHVLIWAFTMLGIPMHDLPTDRYMYMYTCLTKSRSQKVLIMNNPIGNKSEHLQFLMFTWHCSLTWCAFACMLRI